jgi:hypothetical protein
LTVELQNVVEHTYEPRRQQGVTAYREEPRTFPGGDRIQFTAPVDDLKAANRKWGIVQTIPTMGDCI